ncbi:hypothetical protein EVAR_82863_1 [Eumeta japonica]|uniref:Uncharacterized protein n=1 Tax=Eumeta variegata TaxID=151549 RepID=A0A4C1V4T8_EUMVA|nr:hypothetical protein EVAR_82863_1 [Eumeta japonica]
MQRRRRKSQRGGDYTWAVQYARIILIGLNLAASCVAITTIDSQREICDMSGQAKRLPSPTPPGEHSPRQYLHEALVSDLAGWSSQTRNVIGPKQTDENGPSRATRAHAIDGPLCNSADVRQKTQDASVYYVI